MAHKMRQIIDGDRANDFYLASDIDAERAECLRVLKDAKGEIDNINRVASSEFEAQQQIKLIARIAALIKRLEGE